MKRILMVCLGNICRSPLAEGVLRRKLQEKGITDVEVDSAGTSDWHCGENPDARSTANAKKYGTDISKLVARQFSAGDFDRFDRIYVMDASNYGNVMQLARSEADEKKVDLILNSVWPGENRAVPDPYFGGEEGFDKVYRLLDEACERIANDLKNA